jgi:hypothetical protein
MEFEQINSSTSNLFNYNVVSGLAGGEFEHSLSSDCNDEDPFAPLKDLEGLFEEKQQGSLSLQPRSLQEMMRSALGGVDSITENMFKSSTVENKHVVEDVLSEVMHDLDSFQTSCNYFAKPLGLPSTAMSLIPSGEALLSDDILAEIPSTEFDFASGSKRERIESIDCNELFATIETNNEVGNESIVSIVKSIDESLQASLQNKGPMTVVSCSRPTKRSKVEHHMDRFDDLESSSRSSASTDEDSRFRNYQTEKWMAKFGELVEFKTANGHCQVPHSYKENLSLGRWAKRQRYQYKLHKEGKQSTMCEERIAALGELGFVWDSHSALWEERYKELVEFYIAFGHSNAPSSFPPNPKLAIWVKCQRRQRKLLIAGRPSNMNLTRVERLNRLSFVWEVRRVGI